MFLGSEHFFLTGDGKCKRAAAILSPGDSKVTTGAPKVTPNKLARAPPAVALDVVSQGEKKVREAYQESARLSRYLSPGTCRSSYYTDSSC